MDKIHFIGIGGTGLSAIARVLLEDGIQVSGSDLTNSELTAALAELGAKIRIGHSPENLGDAELVVRSSAVPDENVEVQAAREAGIPVLKRADFLPLLTEGKQVIAVAGSHGKTTTTSMIAWIFTALDQDPSFIVGSLVENLRTNARAGQGASFVIEADEYDGMFLGLEPDLGVITNVEHDHPDIYPTEDDFFGVFRQYLAGFKTGAELIYCADDAGANRLVEEIREDLKQIRYGIEAENLDYRAENLQINSRGGTDFEAVILEEEGKKRYLISLQVPGKHNVLNALAAFAVANRSRLSRKWSARALTDYKGSSRRFDVRGTFQGITLIDDYGHHPTEIKSSLAAARNAYPERKLLAVWQPHTYSRTQTLLEEFAVCFEDADQVMMLDVYPARETKPEGFSPEEVVNKIEHPQIRFTPEIEAAVDYLQEALEEGDVLIVFTAGDAIKITDQLEQKFKVEEI